MSKSKILKYCPKQYTPRQIQIDTLLSMEKYMDNANVFVINLPVASGKSFCAITLAHYYKKASIITPTKLLVNQYKDEYPYIHVLRAKRDYHCDYYNCALTDRPKKKDIPALCPVWEGCDGCNQYRDDLRKARALPYLLSNYYIYMAHRLYRDTLIIDEAHQLIPVLQNMSTTKLWQHKYQYPTWVKNRRDIISWINSESNSWRHSADKSYKKLCKEIFSKRPRYLITIGREQYRGEERDCIIMKPLDIRDEPPFMWPSKVKKIILMSATISRKDIEQLGLSDKKVQYIEASSPIAKERRPVFISKNSVSMSYKKQLTNLNNLCSEINRIASINSDSKGLIHATYSLAGLIKDNLRNNYPELYSRMIFHDKDDKTEQYNKFRATEDNKILMASGMYEGIDLPYNAGRWQIIAKIPWPSLADPAIAYMSSIDDEFYVWECLKITLQACGRISRKLDDYGETYIVDSTFNMLYERGVKYGLIPKWFKESIINEAS